MKREPVLTAAIAASAVAAVIGLLVSFGLDVTEGQTQAILTAVSVLFPIGAGLLARSSVTPVAAPRDDAGNYLITTAPAPASSAGLDGELPGLVGLRSEPIDSSDADRPDR